MISNTLKQWFMSNHDIYVPVPVFFLFKKKKKKIHIQTLDINIPSQIYSASCSFLYFSFFFV